MAAKCLRRRYPTEGESKTVGGVFTSGYNLRKKYKGKDGYALGSGPNIDKIPQWKGKSGGEREDKSNLGKHTVSPLKFPTFSQEELKEIYGKKIQIRSTNVEWESEESDEDDDMLTKEELKKTEEYKLTMKGLDAIFGKPCN